MDERGRSRICGGGGGVSSEGKGRGKADLGIMWKTVGKFTMDYLKDYLKRGERINYIFTILICLDKLHRYTIFIYLDDLDI